jgi:hypothetical protein
VKPGTVVCASAASVVTDSGINIARNAAFEDRSETMEFFRHSFTAAVVASLGLHFASSAQAATCKDELDRFERRLHSSSLAVNDADRFQELTRLSEAAAELRDEQRCLQRVAELNEALPEDYSPPTNRNDASAGAGNEARNAQSRPEAPVLLIAEDDDNNTHTDDSGDDAGPQSNARVYDDDY